MFIVSYVVVTVKARLLGFDRHLEEAAMDLGANELTTFLRITLPLLAPRSSAPAARLRHLDRRLRDHLLRRGLGAHVPGARVGGRARRRPPQFNVVASAIFVIAIVAMIVNVLWQRRSAQAGNDRSRMTATDLSRRPATLQQLARDHLWLHFTRMGGYRDAEVPIIVRGDGCYLEDANGRRYLDALAGLFSVNIGYGFGEEIGQAALEQMRELPFYTNWSYAHPKAIELAAEVASLAPGDLNRVFFCSGGSEAVESAWKLARQYYLARGGKRIEAGRGRG